MTAQISDCVLYEGGEFVLAGVNGGGLFEPQQHGLEPTALCSACWRGYQCGYEVADRSLLLKTLLIDLDGEQKEQAAVEVGPLLFGKAPRLNYIDGPVRGRDTKAIARGRALPRVLQIRYDLSAPIGYSGGLLLGRGFIEELYVHMGFHPAWKFQEVHELIFRDGQLITGADRSAEMGALRDGMPDRSAKAKGPRTGEKLTDWISKCFSLDYRW